MLKDKHHKIRLQLAKYIRGYVSVSVCATKYLKWFCSWLLLLFSFDYCCVKWLHFFFRKHIIKGINGIQWEVGHLLTCFYGSKGGQLPVGFHWGPFFLKIKIKIHLCLNLAVNIGLYLHPHMYMFLLSVCLVVMLMVVLSRLREKSRTLCLKQYTRHLMISSVLR